MSLKNVVFILVFSFVSLIAVSCKTNGVESGEEKVVSYKEQGDSIAFIAQQELLKHVKREMKAGGALKAINYCNVNALPLMDSLSTKLNLKISRITDKPRNAKNRADEEEAKILYDLREHALNDTLIKSMGEITYYKSIHLGMKTCLKCHGTVEDVHQETMITLQSLYPYDEAMNYGFGEFRGAWKIEMKK